MAESPENKNSENTLFMRLSVVFLTIRGNKKISKKLLTNNDKHDILLKLSALIKNAGNNMNIDN